MSQCPTCRENLLDVPTVRGYGRGAQGREEIRKGLLYMLLAGVFYYFASGSSPLPLPFSTPNLLTETLLPLLFLAGMGLAIYGLFRRFTA